MRTNFIIGCFINPGVLLSSVIEMTSSSET